MIEEDPRLPVSRRALLLGGGAVVVAFSMFGRALAQETETPEEEEEEEEEQIELPGSLDDARTLDSWIQVDPDGTITVFTGKAELGQGIRTALLQVAAEELNVAPALLAMVTADTVRTPDEGYTAGSNSMQDSGVAIRHAAAQVRTILLDQAAERLGVAAADLTTEDGVIAAPDGTTIGFGELVAGDVLAVEALPDSVFKDPSEFRFMGQTLPRVDIPAKVTGAVAYVHDLRLPGMLHARVIRPPSTQAVLESVATEEVEAMPGVVSVVRDGSFLAVVAEKEFQAITAMRRLGAACVWRETPTLPDMAELTPTLRGLVSETGTVDQQGAADPVSAQQYQATYTRDYQIHGAIGPSCAVAVMEDETLRIWSHTQGVYPDRTAISEMLGMPLEAVHITHMEGSGCYGHNGADDAAADAALIARALPGTPVRVQWTREQEHAWEPYGPAMSMDIGASLDENGRIASWSYDLYSNIHSTRPGPAGALIPARYLASPFTPPTPELNISLNGNGDRNAIPLYTIPNTNILWHFIEDMPLRVSALRALGAYANVFAIESTIDELALMADRDPVEFRLDHLDDPRARDVVATAADRFGWAAAAVLPPNRGRGFAFARYKNLAAYLAVAVELEIERESGRMRVLRAVSAIDSGEIVSPDGIRNQTEGGLIQAFSWTLYEAVKFDRTRIETVDWSSYPIMRFAGVPDSVEVHIIDRPGEPFLGTGEAAQGPAAAAIGNAVRHATGHRVHDLPITRDRLKAVIGA